MLIRVGASWVLAIGLAGGNGWAILASGLAILSSEMSDRRSNNVFWFTWIAFLGAGLALWWANASSHGWLLAILVFGTFHYQKYRTYIEALSALYLCLSGGWVWVVPVWVAIKSWQNLEYSHRWLSVVTVASFGFANWLATDIQEKSEETVAGALFAPELDLLRPESLESDSVVARVSIPDVLAMPPVLYVRAAALEHFDGSVWRSRSEPEEYPSDLGGMPVRFHIERDLPVVLTWGRVAAVLSVPANGDGQGGFRSVVPSGANYWIRVLDPERGPMDPVEAEHLLRPSVSEASRRWLDEHRPWGSPRVRMSAWSKILSEQADYVRDPEPSVQPLDDLLFGSRQGDCERFANALALAARQDGIPSRVVVGYAAHTKENREFVVRASDAHAWVEVFIEGEGWIPFDATPGGRAMEPGLASEEAVSWWFLALLPLCGLPLLWRRKVDSWTRAQEILGKKGWHLPGELPPLSQARWLKAQVGDVAEPLEQLAWAIYRVEYRGDANFDPAPYFSSLASIPGVDEVR